MNHARGAARWMAAPILFIAVTGFAGADSRVTAEFTLGMGQLRAMTATLPPEIQEGIGSRPAQFLQEIAEVLDQPADLFVLVDKQHPLAPDYVPPDLVPLRNYPLKTMWPGLWLRKAVIPAALDMARAAESVGLTLTFSSAYRSYAYQRYVFDREVRAYGLTQAERESAPAGCSQHQLGTAIDFGTISDAFAETREGRWVAAHAWEFGFSLSYPAGCEAVTGYRQESWHYRYLTPAGTHVQREFFGDVQQYFLVFLHKWRATLERSRR